MSEGYFDGGMMKSTTLKVVWTGFPKCTHRKKEEKERDTRK